MKTPEIEETYRLESHHWWFVGKRLLLDSLLADALSDGDLRLLDVGCGTGAVLAHLEGRARTVGVDRSPFALGFCQRRGLVRLACADGERLPFAPASFDGILLLDALEHFVDEAAVLRDVRALLRPGGWLLVSVPAFQFLWSTHDEVLHHVRRYTARTLRRTLEGSHFTVHRVTYTNVVAFLPALVLRGLLPRLGIARRRGTDFGAPSVWLNRALTGAYRLEADALRYIRRLPFGLSVAALARVTPP